MEDDVEANVSNLNEVKTPCSPSWPWDDENDEDEEDQEMTQMIHIQDDRPMH